MHTIFVLISMITLLSAIQTTAESIFPHRIYVIHSGVSTIKQITSASANMRLTNGTYSIREKIAIL